MTSLTSRLVRWGRTGLFGAFCVAVITTPVDGGSNTLDAWSRNAIVFGVLGVLTALLNGLRPSSPPPAFPATAVVLMALVIAFIGLQVVPLLPEGLANPLWATASMALGETGLVRGAVSVDPDLTMLAALRLGTALMVLWLAADLSADEGRALLLIGAIGAAGAGYALYGFVAAPPSTTARGAFMASVFVNRNNFATYCGIALVCLAGLLSRQVRIQASHSAGVARLQWADAIDLVLGRAAVPIVAALLVLVALLLTGSRAGILASVFGLVVLAILVRPGSQAAGSRTGLGFALAGLVVAAALIAGEVLRTRLQDAGVDDPNRLRVYVITLRSIAASPWLGYGYGTFERVFPLFRDASMDATSIWEKAHSSYLEIYQGLGLVMGTAFLAAWAVVIRRCHAQATGGRRNRTVPAVAVAASAVVAAHSAVDFSLQIQAVTLTYAAVLGAGLAHAAGSPMRRTATMGRDPVARPVREDHSQSKPDVV